MSEEILTFTFGVDAYVDHRRFQSLFQMDRILWISAQIRSQQVIQANNLSCSQLSELQTSSSWGTSMSISLSMDLP
jgi:hypothetical protein